MIYTRKYIRFASQLIGQVNTKSCLQTTALTAKHVETLRLIGNIYGKKDTKNNNILTILPGINVRHLMINVKIM